MTNHCQPHESGQDDPPSNDDLEREDADEDEEDEDDEEEDDPEEIDFPSDLYGFEKGDKQSIEYLGSVLKSALSRADLTNNEIYEIVRLIRAVELLPLCIDDAEAELAVTEQLAGGSTRTLYLGLDSLTFELSEVFWYVAADPNIGSDSSSNTCFRVEPGGYREITYRHAIRDWASGLRALLAQEGSELSISACGVDLNGTLDEDDDEWERLPK